MLAQSFELLINFAKAIRKAGVKVIVVDRLMGINRPPAGTG